MSEFHDDFPQYELMAHHSEEEGKTKRKKLWRVFWIMLAITIVELVIGFKADLFSRLAIKIIFISLTIAKAGYIVLSFMHLGDEKKVFKYTVLAPYTLFAIYLVFIVLTEGSYSEKNAAGLANNIIEQQERLKAGHHSGAANHDEGTSHDENTKEEHHE